MEERLIVLYDDDSPEYDIYVHTNAPDNLIKEALCFRDKCLELDLKYDNDLDLIQCYVEKEGYTFFETVPPQKFYW